MKDKEKLQIAIHVVQMALFLEAYGEDWALDMHYKEDDNDLLFYFNDENIPPEIKGNEWFLPTMKAIAYLYVRERKKDKMLEIEKMLIDMMDGEEDDEEKGV